MTYREALAKFRNEVLPTLRSKDKPAVGQAWNEFIDELARSGQAKPDRWDNPFYR